MKGDFIPLERCGFGRWYDHCRSNGLDGCSGEEVSSLASLTTYTASTITLCYILLTSILFTIPFPQRSLLVRPTKSLDWPSFDFLQPSLMQQNRNGPPKDSQGSFIRKMEMEQWSFLEPVAHFFSSDAGNGTVNNLWNYTINSLTPSALHDVMLWNSDNKDHKTTTAPLHWTRLTSLASSRPNHHLSWGIGLTNTILPYKSLSL